MSRSKKSYLRRAPVRRLPLRRLQGEFLIAEPAITETERLLKGYRDPLGDHEGIVFWCGRPFEDLTIFTSALAPKAETSPGSVWCTEEQMAEAVEAARQLGLGLLAQVHSHPGSWVEHSLGDDEMVFMRFEGMLSIVVPRYASVPMRPLANLGIHQYQDGGWVAAERASVAEQVRIVPAGIDLR